MPNPAPGFTQHPGYAVDIKSLAGEVTVRVDDQIVATSSRALAVTETKHRPVWYLPLDDIDSQLIQSTEHTTYCPFKGHASYWSIVLEHRTIENAIWAYLEPYDECEPLRGFASFYTNSVDLRLNGESLGAEGPGWA